MLPSPPLPAHHRLFDLVLVFRLNLVLCLRWSAASSNQIFGGGKQSGASMHFHSAAYNVLFFGTKHWLLTPPRWAAISASKSSDWEDLSRRSLPHHLPLKCTQSAGDMLLLPKGWGHATINHGFTIGIGNLFCDSENANETGDPSRCSSIYQLGSEWSEGRLRPALLRALGGTWPLGNEFNFSYDRRASSPETYTFADIGMLRPALTNIRVLTRNLTAGPASPTLLRVPPRPGATTRHPGCEPEGPLYKTIAFVHINKAGGTLMRSYLLNFSSHQMLELLVPGAGARLAQLGARFFHASAHLQRQVLGEDLWASSFTFALVRNPWARQVSMFHYLLTVGSCKRAVGMRAASCEQRKLPAPGLWLNNPSEAIRKFRIWIRDLFAIFPPGRKDSHLFGSNSHGNERNPWHNASQLSWLVDQSGKILVNRVIKLEELEAEWPMLQREICGLASMPYSDNGPLRNPSSHSHYSEYYDDETSAILIAHMAPDIHHFNYSFERPK